MKALVKSKAEPGLWMQDVPDPEVRINDVLINEICSGIIPATFQFRCFIP